MMTATPGIIIAMVFFGVLILGGIAALVVVLTKVGGAGKVTCPACGQSIEGDSRFCRFCGAAQPMPGFPAQGAQQQQQ